VLEGPASLFARREAIDEYGWRSYGDIDADHENAYYDGPKPVISHYNSQFDTIWCSGRSCSSPAPATGAGGSCPTRSPVTSPTSTSTIYHTDEDRAAYCGGLFWMTDHYLDAATSTHRTYSRANRRPGRPYGGGPGCEHNFTTGLLYYYYLTGDSLAREAVLSLADWVVRRDDGRLTALGLLDAGPTGLASYTADPAAAPVVPQKQRVKALLRSPRRLVRALARRFRPGSAVVNHR
jgi:hypothetical protein